MGMTSGSVETMAQSWLTHCRTGDVFFRIRKDYLLNAHKTQGEPINQTRPPDKPVSWREFRILAAILSQKPNRHGFTFMGWKPIQARSCGYHNKQLFERGREQLPEHCQPLTRSQIRTATAKLEHYEMYARSQYSRGPGGYMAYSFRLTTEQLRHAISAWAKSRSGGKVADRRSDDREYFAKQSPTDNQHIANIKSDGTQDDQACRQHGRQVRRQHKEKDSKEKYPKEKDKDPSGAGSLALPFGSDEFRLEWDSWEKHLKEKKRPLTQTARQHQLTLLGEMGEERATAALRHSLANGYQGIYEPRETSTSTTQRPASSLL
jgi:hypothetical protein